MKGIELGKALKKSRIPWTRYSLANRYGSCLLGQAIIGSKAATSHELKSLNILGSSRLHPNRAVAEKLAELIGINDGSQSKETVV